MSDNEKSVIDVIGWCQDLEQRLKRVEAIEKVCIQSGEVSKVNDPDLKKGEGERKSIEKISFDQEYANPPEVIVALSGINTGSDWNARLEVYAENITCQGSDIVIRTWRQSNVLYARVSWIAVGVID